MPISGPDMHRQLLAAYNDYQRRVETARGQILHARDQRIELGENRDDVLVSLAEHYLPELTRDSIETMWVELRHDVANVLLRKEAEEQEIQRRRDHANARREAADQKLLELNERLDEAQQRQRELSDQVEQQLQRDMRFVELSDRAAKAEIAVERAEANLREIEQDAARKLPSFEDSSLFQYLRERGFGTSRYSHRGFTRRMDRWVARFINYNEANQSYDFLTQTPLQMRQIISEDRTALETVLDECERRRDEMAQAIGLDSQVRVVQQLVLARDAEIRNLGQIQDELKSVDGEWSSLQSRDNVFYRQAVDVVHQSLKRFDTETLRDQAASTRDITDDQIVARLLGVESEISNLDERALEQRREVDRLQSIMEGVGRLIQQFRAAKFDTGRSQFSDAFNLYAEVGHLEDARELDDVWNRLRQAQSWGPSAMDHITEIATHPMTQVLINAMAHAAAGALSEHARNAGRRRNIGGPGWHVSIDKRRRR